MHIRCYEERDDVKAVVHAHPPIATGFTLAHIPLDTYSLIESAIVIGSIPITPFGVPSTMEVPDAITPYLQEHDVMLLENHGALTVGSDVITAYHRMETLELVAKSTFHGRMLLLTKALKKRNLKRKIRTNVQDARKLQSNRTPPRITRNTIQTELFVKRRKIGGIK